MDESRVPSKIDHVGVGENVAQGGGDSDRVTLLCRRNQRCRGDISAHRGVDEDARWEQENELCAVLVLTGVR